MPMQWESHSSPAIPSQRHGSDSVSERRNVQHSPPPTSSQHGLEHHATPVSVALSAWEPQEAFQEGTPRGTFQQQPQQQQYQQSAAESTMSPDAAPHHPPSRRHQQPRSSPLAELKKRLVSPRRPRPPPQTPPPRTPPPQTPPPRPPASPYNFAFFNELQQIDDAASTQGADCSSSLSCISSSSSQSPPYCPSPLLRQRLAAATAPVPVPPIQPPTEAPTGNGGLSPLQSVVDPGPCTPLPKACDASPLGSRVSPITSPIKSPKPETAAALHVVPSPLNELRRKLTSPRMLRQRDMPSTPRSKQLQLDGATLGLLWAENRTVSIENSKLKEVSQELSIENSKLKEELERSKRKLEMSAIKHLLTLPDGELMERLQSEQRQLDSESRQMSEEAAATTVQSVPDAAQNQEEHPFAVSAGHRRKGVMNALRQLAAVIDEEDSVVDEASGPVRVMAASLDQMSVEDQAVLDAYLNVHPSTLKPAQHAREQPYERSPAPAHADISALQPFVPSGIPATWLQNGCDCDRWSVSLQQLEQLQEALEAMPIYDLTWTVEQVAKEYLLPLTQSQRVGFGMHCWLNDEAKRQATGSPQASSLPAQVQVLVNCSGKQLFGELVDCLRWASLEGPMFIKWFSCCVDQLDNATNEDLRGLEAAVIKAAGVGAALLVHAAGEEGYVYDDSVYYYNAGLRITHIALPHVLQRALQSLETTKNLLHADDLEMGLRIALNALRCKGEQQLRGKSVEPAFWAMDLEQLKNLQRDVNCIGGYSNWSMAQLVNEVIIPETAGSGLGWALYMNRRAPKHAKHLVTVVEMGTAVKPDLLDAAQVSHSWQQNFDIGFADTLLQAADGVITGPIWVCAFAMYQPNDGAGPSVRDQIGLDLKEGPFFKVLMSQQVRDCGSVLLLCDQEQHIFSRLWCVLEMHEAGLAKVDVKALGDNRAAHRVETLHLEAASCGPASERMNYDTRLIRRMIQNSVGFQSLNQAITDLRRNL